MESSEYRDRLAEVLGAEAYLRILAHLNAGGRWKGRFRYWQEQFLLPFVNHPHIGPATYETIEAHLRVCQLHGVDLKEDLRGCSNFAHGAVGYWTQVSGEWFPNTDCGPLSINPPTGQWYCPTCRSLEVMWEAREFGAVQASPGSSAGAFYVGTTQINVSRSVPERTPAQRAGNRESILQAIDRLRRQLELRYITLDEAAGNLVEDFMNRTLITEDALDLIEAIPPGMRPQMLNLIELKLVPDDGLPVLAPERARALALRLSLLNHRL